MESLSQCAWSLKLSSSSWPPVTINHQKQTVGKNVPPVCRGFQAVTECELAPAASAAECPKLTCPNGSSANGFDQDRIISLSSARWGMAFVHVCHCAQHALTWYWVLDRDSEKSRKQRVGVGANLGDESKIICSDQLFDYVRRMVESNQNMLDPSPHLQIEVALGDRPQ